MLKNKLFIFLGAVTLLLSFSSCGIFGKGCGCPEFGNNKPFSKPSLALRQHSPRVA